MAHANARSVMRSSSLMRRSSNPAACKALFTTVLIPIKPFPRGEVVHAMLSIPSSRASQQGGVRRGSLVALLSPGSGPSVIQREGHTVGFGFDGTVGPPLVLAQTERGFAVEPRLSPGEYFEMLVSER